MRAVTIRAYGGPEELKFEERPDPEQPFPAAVRDLEACYRGLVGRRNHEDRPYWRLGWRQPGLGASVNRIRPNLPKCC